MTLADFEQFAKESKEFSKEMKETTERIKRECAAMTSKERSELDEAEWNPFRKDEI